MTLYVDIETYSSVDLPKSGVYKYAESPDFMILMAAWAVDDGPISVAFSAEEVIGIPGLWDADVVKVAHNAAFERVCFSRFAGAPTGQYMRSQEWLDTAVLAAEYGYPRSLENAAKALGAEEKDSAGTALIKLFCVPNKDGRRNLPEEFPDKWDAFVKYCIQDVSTLRDIHHRLPAGFPTEMEERAYHVDQAINDRGMPADRDLIRDAIEATENNKMTEEVLLSHATGIKNPGSPIQVKTWLEESGLEVPNLQAETVERLLERDDLTAMQRRVLEARQNMALAASSKFAAAERYINRDDRIRGQFLFFGAHTGRWTGRGVQPQNLPREKLSSDTEVEAAIVDLALGSGADSRTLKALVRSMFLGPMVVADFASIEARVVAWLAGEQWVLDAARAGRDLYVETAERMGGLTRSEGKVAVLALGYAGGKGSLRHMGAQGSDEQLQFLVNQWREASPNIVRFWARLDDAFYNGGVCGRIRVDVDDRVRRVLLPSGRSIVYRDVKKKWVMTEYGPKPRLVYTDPRRGPTETYGGRLTENVTQAVARDILAEALVRLEDAGYETIGHVHDECLVAGEDIAGVTYQMTRPTSWSRGLPIDCAAFVAKRYKKD